MDRYLQTAAALRQRAQRLRRLASALIDEIARQKLLNLAEELDAEAAGIDRGGVSDPSP
jgi:hypothetical protein